MEPSAKMCEYSEMKYSILSIYGGIKSDFFSNVGNSLASGGQKMICSKGMQFIIRDILYKPMRNYWEEGDRREEKKGPNTRNMCPKFSLHIGIRLFLGPASSSPNSFSNPTSSSNKRQESSDKLLSSILLDHPGHNTIKVT